MMQGKRILVLAPHTDDGELGCGATINKYVEISEVWYAAFSACRQSLPSDFPENTLELELRKATVEFGIREQNLVLFDYEVRTFNQHRQRILDDLLRLKTAIKPDIIFTPLPSDVHQDHAALTAEAIRAFKFSSLLGYELPWNNLSFSPTYFVSVEPRHLDTKCKAIAAYKSQAHRPYTKPEFIRSLAAVRGVQAGVEIAEAFEVIRWID